MDSYDTLEEELMDWDNTLMDGLDENEPFEIDIISMDEMLPDIETVIIEEPIPASSKGISETINTSSSTVGGKGPLYAFRTNVLPDDDKNRSINLD
jgi:hypothetical protein